MNLYTISVGTIKGSFRENNEDNFYCYGIFKEDLLQNDFSYSGIVSETSLIAGVFDGMGGTENGKMAAYIAVKYLDTYAKLIHEMERAFDGIYVLKKINQCICAGMKRNSVNMGSTAVILVCNSERLQVFNLGDSKAYMFRDGILTQLSVDHTAENCLKEIQKSLGISGESQVSCSKNTLTQYLGIPEDEFMIEPAVSEKVWIKKNDIYMLCSDGLTSVVSEQQMTEILSLPVDLEAKKNRLIKAAQENGSKDNITVVLVQTEKKFDK